MVPEGCMASSHWTYVGTCLYVPTSKLKYTLWLFEYTALMFLHDLNDSPPARNSLSGTYGAFMFRCKHRFIKWVICGQLRVVRLEEIWVLFLGFSVLFLGGSKHWWQSGAPWSDRCIQSPSSTVNTTEWFLFMWAPSDGWSHQATKIYDERAWCARTCCVSGKKKVVLGQVRVARGAFFWWCL